MGDDALEIETEIDAASCEFFDDDCFVGKRPAAAPTLLRYVCKQQTHFTRSEPRVGVRISLLFPLGVVGRELRFDEMPNAPSK